MCAKRQATDDDDATDSNIFPTSPQYSGDEDDIFVLEDDYLPVHDYLSRDTDDEPKVIWNQLPKPSAFIRTSILTDLLILLSIVAIVYGLVVTTGSLFSTTPYASLKIDTSLHVLPWYAAQSLTRMMAAYLVSLAFSLGYAYLAHRVKFAAKLLILAIDVLQSIPLLSFLPGVVLGLIAIFPGARIGVELAAVLLLFTSMAWNMLLGFYQSLSCIPHDLVDVAGTFRLSAWKRFWTLELPAGAIGLVWNSIISVAGGWFFLISIESFELGNRDFKLPGLGSFLAMAAESSNFSAIFAGLLTVIAIIVTIDFCVWRPLIAWAAKFTYGGHSSGDEGRPRSLVFNTLQRSALMRSFHTSIVAPAWDDFVNLRYRNPFTGNIIFVRDETNNKIKPGSNNAGVKAVAIDRRKDVGIFKAVKRIFENTARAVCAAISQSTPVIAGLVTVPALGYCLWQAVRIVRVIPAETWMTIATASVMTFGRVLAALTLSLLWTVPAGVAIGRNPKLSALLQPIVQIAASVPATALFPFLLLFLARLGGGLEIGSIALMMLGTMWYILFNVIAGAQAIPGELFDVDAVYNKEGWLTRWRTLILPGIFPYLITGIVTAVGGAWNASIVSEFVVFQGGVLKTHGLGALISEAAGSGNYAVLLAGTVVMSVLVLLTNKLVWSPLYRLAETKYRT